MFNSGRASFCKPGSRYWHFKSVVLLPANVNLYDHAGRAKSSAKLVIMPHESEVRSLSSSSPRTRTVNRSFCGTTASGSRFRRVLSGILGLAAHCVSLLGTPYKSTWNQQGLHFPKRVSSTNGWVFWFHVNLRGVFHQVVQPQNCLHGPFFVVYGYQDMMLGEQNITASGEHCNWPKSRGKLIFKTVAGKENGEASFGKSSASPYRVYPCPFWPALLFCRWQWICVQPCVILSPK